VAKSVNEFIGVLIEAILIVLLVMARASDILGVSRGATTNRPPRRDLNGPSIVTRV
jgi:hypothetical protein